MRAKLQVPTVAELASLIRRIKQSIAPEFRAYEEDDKPGILLTVGADETGWDYQTGDNSYSGGAYHYAHWSVAGIYRRTNSRKMARDMIEEIRDAAAC